MNSIGETTTNNSVIAIKNSNFNPECESDYDRSNDNMVASIATNTLQIEPINTILQIENTKSGLLIDSHD